MTTTSMATQETTSQAVARPLSVLVPLIQKDINSGREAAQSAGTPFYLAAGEKLIEAKSQLNHGEFGGWVKRNFGVAASTASNWMEYARKTANFPHGKYESLTEAKSNPEFKINRKTAWFWMDYAEQVKTWPVGPRFTFAEYRKLKRKPPKAEKKSDADAETNNTSSTDETARNKRKRINFRPA